MLIRITFLLFLLTGLFSLTVPHVYSQTPKKVVVLDPGHCSNDKYKENKVAENSLNILQANALAKLLNANGYDARVYNPKGDGSCSEDDYYMDLQARVDFANNANAALFISIHQDRGAGAGTKKDTFSGISAENGPFPSESRKLAGDLSAAAAAAVTAKGKAVTAITEESRGIGTDADLDYYVLGPKGGKTGGHQGGKVPAIINQRNMPGVIMENYMVAGADYKSTYPYVDAIALGYCNGISKFLDNKQCDGSVSASADLDITIIGDSLTERASSQIKTVLPKATIDAAVSRQWSEGVTILQKLVTEAKVGSVIVFALGTNGPMTDDAVDQVMKLAGDKKVVFMTTFGTSNAAVANGTSHNAAVQKALTRYPGKVALIDWRSVASSHPEWFADDTLGVHPNDEGTKAFAQAVAQAAGVNSVASTGTSGNLDGGGGGKAVWCTKVGNPTVPRPVICTSTSTATPGGPRPSAPEPGGEIRDAIIAQFGITMNGYDRQRLQWVWEKMWEVSHTKFPEIVKGSVINVTSTSNSHQVGCPGAAVAVYLGPFNNEVTFKQAFIHELGHVVANCSTKQTANWGAYLKAHVAEGGVSHYGRNAPSCTGSDSISEDFAEMIAFYLNVGDAVSIVACNGTPEKVNLETQYPLHFAVARDILGPF